MDALAIVEAAGVIVTVVGALVAFFWRQVASARGAAEKTASDLNDFKLEVVKEYLSKVEFREAVKEFRDVIHRELAAQDDKFRVIFEKLDRLLQPQLKDGER